MISQIIEKMNEGGAVFTYPILATSIVVTIYFIKALRDKLRMNGYALLTFSGICFFIKQNIYRDFEYNRKQKIVI